MDRHRHKWVYMHTAPNGVYHRCKCGTIRRTVNLFMNSTLFQYFYPNKEDKPVRRSVLRKKKGI